MAYSYRLLAALILVSIVLFWPPLTFFALVPITMLYCIKGPRYALGGMLFAALAIWILSGISLFSLMFLMVAGIPALVMGTLIKKNTEAGHTIILSTALLLVSLVLLIVILEQVGQLSFSLEFQRMLRDSTDKAYQFYRNRGVSTEDLSLIKRNSWRLLRVLDLIWPSILAIIVGCFVYFDYIISGKLLRRYGVTIKSLPALRQWHGPEWMIWAFIIPSGLLVGNTIFKISMISWLYSGLLNVLVVVGFVYFIQGLSIASYYFNRVKIGKLPQVLFFLLIAFNRDLWFVLMLLGILDIWMDWRKLNKTVVRN
jgi:uncharacterized protein YybS (DUF2232 family)